MSSFSGSEKVASKSFGKEGSPKVEKGNKHTKKVNLNQGMKKLLPLNQSHSKSHSLSDVSRGNADNSEYSKKKHHTDVFPLVNRGDEEENREKTRNLTRLRGNSRNQRKNNHNFEHEEAAVVPVSFNGGDEFDETESKISGATEQKHPSTTPKIGSTRTRRNQPGRLKNSIYSNQSFSHRSRGMSEVIHKSIADISNSAILRKSSFNVNVEEKAILGISRTTIEELDHDLDYLHDHCDFGGVKYDHFDFFGKDHSLMLPYFSDAFNELELNHVYNDDETLLNSFLLQVVDKYKSPEEVAFHNFYHGFSVAQIAIIFILRSKDLKMMYDRKTLFTLVIAAVAHDVAHPGNDNHYEIITTSPNAKLFNNDSVLENYHTRTTLEILRGSKEKTGDMKFNVFKYLKPETQKQSFHQIASLILATDMSKHKEHLEFLKSVKSLKDLATKDESENEKLLEAVIHACDLSGQCFSTQLAKEWELRIHSEMARQCTKLIKQNLPIPAHLEYLKQTEGQLKARYESQTKFIQFALIPYWSEVVRLFPCMHDFLENLKVNKAYFEKAAAKEK